MSAKHNTPKMQPPIVAPEHISTPEVNTTTLPNGISLHTIDCSEQDVVRVSFVFRAGTTLQSVPFCASTTANMLSEGSASFTSHEIAERLDFYGSYYSVSLDRDYVVITFVSLSKFLAPTLDIAREILLYPSFSDDEISIYCSKRKYILAAERSKISFQARELFGKSLFGESHPYGVTYPEELFDNIKRSDLELFYRNRYTAANCFVVCSGKIGTLETALISSLASDIPSGGDTSLPVFPATQSQRMVFSASEGAVQSCIRIGRLLFPRSHPDFIPMQIVSTVLGGYFGSRLVRNLREERGYTYGVFSTVVNLDYNGYMAIATEVGKDATADSVSQIFHEMSILRDELISESELQLVRNIMIGEVMRILDGPFGIADVTIENIENGTDNAYLNTLLHQIRHITPTQVRDYARLYLTPDSFTTVVVGDPSVEGAFAHTEVPTGMPILGK